MTKKSKKTPGKKKSSSNKGGHAKKKEAALKNDGEVLKDNKHFPEPEMEDLDNLSDEEFRRDYVIKDDSPPSNNDQTQDDYEVGYKKPPKTRQFKKGQSGNPAGRPKGIKNSSTLAYEIGNEMIDVTINGEAQQISFLEAVIRGMWNKGLKEQKLDTIRFLTELYDKRAHDMKHNSIEHDEYDVVLARFMANCALSLTPWQYLAELTNDDIKAAINGVRIIASRTDFLEDMPAK